MTLQVGRPAPLSNSRGNSIAPTPLQNHFPPGGVPPQNGVHPQMPMPGMNPNLPGLNARPVQNVQQVPQPQPQVFNKFIQVIFNF